MTIWKVFVMVAIGFLLGGLLGCSQFNTKLEATDGYQEVTTPIGIGVLIRTDTWFGLTTGPEVGTAHERSNWNAAGDRRAEGPMNSPVESSDPEANREPDTVAP